MSSRPPHKRHVSDNNAGPSVKKTRFAQETNVHELSPADQPVSAEEFDAQVADELELSNKRGKVKVDGYESDSTDEGEGVVESRTRRLKKKKKGGDGDDEDDFDMFAKEEGEEDDEELPMTKKKSTKFMNLGDIEGQEFGGTEDVDSDEEDEPEDEDEAERRKKRGMGYELSSFNMKDEMEEGKFAEDGSYIRSYDPHQMHDRWMEGMDDREIKKARKSRKKMEEKEQERQKREAAEGLNKSKEELEKELLEFVQPGETVLQTLSRLGAEKKKAEGGKPKPKSRSAKAVLDPVSMSIDGTSQRPPPDSKTAPIDRVTALASTLMSLGNLHIYDETHRTLLFSVRESGIVPSDWTPAPPAPPPSSTIKYEYRWSPEYLATAQGGAKEGDLFGPFSKDELLAWKAASYFGESGERIQLRQVGTDKWSDWSIV